MRNPPVSFHKIETESNSLQEISLAIEEAFQNEFNLTTTEMMDYLLVKDRWIRYNFKDSVKYIYLNTVAKRALMQHGLKKWAYLHPYKKIFHRKAFFAFVLQNTTIDKKPVEQIPTQFTSLQQIMSRYNLSQSTVYKLLQEHHVQKYTVFGMSRYDLETIDAIFSHFKEQQQLAMDLTEQDE
ncbi:hypothetical protein [Listeria fleischmannii]|uniref:hypothetical protein n=1 Tax=Listeria fleischmannii TaxID=1069827 RepID=UPI001628A638|nr:hypothetical protein [Listeria fleischmannii]MBC1419915.1 hypothetical protein [Listeria fleischmannii]